MPFPTQAVWGAGGWKALPIAPGNGVNAFMGEGGRPTGGARPANWWLPGFDDSGWPTIQLPLGGGNKSCPIHSQHPSVTNWPINSEYLLRRWFTGEDFTVEFAVDNEGWILWDGVQYGYGTNVAGGEDCPDRDDNAPASGSLGYDDHLLAVHVRDWGGETYFDCQVSLTGVGVVTTAPILRQRQRAL